MSRPLPIAAVQAPALAAHGPIDRFADDVAAVVAAHPATRLVIYPELHLCGVDLDPALKAEALRSCAEPLDGPRTHQLAALAAEHDIWLIPGSVCELGPGGELFNTALAFSPEGELVAWYRKVFPWRPHEPFDPGSRFVVFDLDDVGTIGLSVCYDAWFPETSRMLAWLGAELIVTPFKTTTADRAQELVLTRANAIVNQVYVVGVNAAAPGGVGRSLIVDPEGRVRVQAPGAARTVLADVIDLETVTATRRYGTAGLNRPWSQFTAADLPLELPLYDGRIRPARWHARGTADVIAT